MAKKSSKKVEETEALVEETVGQPVEEVVEDSTNSVETEEPVDEESEDEEKESRILSGVMNEALI